MAGWIPRKRASPIGVDVGSRSVKLVQLSADRSRLHQAARWDLPAEEASQANDSAGRLADAIRQAHEGRSFRGRDAVVCLGPPDLFVQNMRVPKATGASLDQIVRQEAAERVPFPIAETEIRYLEAADVRQGDTTRREVVVLACHRPVLSRLLEAVDAAGLRPVAVEVEPCALVRCYATQFRRDEDKQQRFLLVHIGAANTAVIVAQGTDVLFIKYLELGGRNLDEAVARHLNMELGEARALRRQHGDRRTDQQDPEVARSIAEAVRPVVDRLTNEISLCTRYHSVTFRGQPLARLVLGGGEAMPGLVDKLQAQLDVRCELGDPLRSYDQSLAPGRKTQWDVALGLALRQGSQRPSRASA